MNTPQAITIAAILVAVSILFSGGIYEFSSINLASAHRYNKFTGSTDLCAVRKGCKSFSE